VIVALTHVTFEKQNIETCTIADNGPDRNINKAVIKSSKTNIFLLHDEERLSRTL